MTVFFFVGKAKGPRKNDLNKNIHLVILNKPKIVLAAYTLSKHLKSNKVEVLISTLLNANVCNILATKLFSPKTRAIIREASVPSQASLNRKSKLLVRLAKFLFKHADSAIAVSKEVRKDFIDFYGVPSNKVHIVYNHSGKVRPKKKPRHPFYTENYTEKRIVAVGRITPVKNFSLLVDAFYEVSRHIDSTLVILGQKELNPAETKKVEDKIKSLGIDDRVDLPGFEKYPEDYVHHSDVLVLSSNYEGFPNVIILSLMCGTPVVATDCSGGIREILDHGNYGLLTPPGSITEMSSAILQQLRKPFPSTESIRKRSSFFSKEKSTATLKNLIENHLDN